MTHDDEAGRALERAVDEARRASIPELDWSAVEAKLLLRVARVERAPAPRPSRLPWLLAAAVTLATVVVGLRTVGRHPAALSPVAESSARGEAPARGGATVNGDALLPGAVVTAGARAVVVDHAGHATWTLEPGGAAHIEGVGDVVAIALDGGSISAHVTKSTRPESFVVRVGQTRVAVHGTRFRVERFATTVRITVTEGVVGVGPVGGPSVDLPAPGSATMPFDGTRADAREQPSRATRAAPPGAEPATTNGKTGGRPPLARAAAAPAEPPAGATPGIEAAVQGVQRCFAESTVSGAGVRVSVRTHMSLRVQASGSLSEAIFEPPLAPAVQRCVDSRLGSLRLPGTSGGFAVERALDLGR